MPKQYIHVWNDGDEYLIQEHQPANSYKQAERLYDEQVALGFIYWNTIVVDLDAGLSSTIDIEENLREKRELQIREHELEMAHERSELLSLRGI